MDNIELEELYDVIKDRKNNPEEGSYTTYLFSKGIEKILKKVGEESTEVIISSLNGNKAEQIGEMCDLVYHLTVLMVKLDISLDDIGLELEKRHEITHNLKEERREIEYL